MLHKSYLGSKEEDDDDEQQIMWKITGNAHFNLTLEHATTKMADRHGSLHLSTPISTLLLLLNLLGVKWSKWFNTKITAACCYLTKSNQCVNTKQNRLYMASYDYISKRVKLQFHAQHNRNQISFSMIETFYPRARTALRVYFSLCWCCCSCSC
jgi:hypothetical protein